MTAYYVSGETRRHGERRAGGIRIRSYCAVGDELMRWSLGAKWGGIVGPGRDDPKVTFDHRDVMRNPTLKVT